MNDHQIIQLLKDTGHLEFPFGKRETIPGGAGMFSVQEGTTLTHPTVERAIASYQDFMIQHLDPLTLTHHSRTARCDGGIGPATHELFDMPRCGCCDYGEAVLPAVGNGSWARCHDIGEFHAATVNVHKQGMPSFLEPLFEQMWDRIQAAFDAIGLRFIRTEDDNANIDWRFETRRKSWIGLAQVGQGETCTSNLWCKYLASYRPSNILNEWTTLGLHELRHNSGGEHTRGGIMSPSIIPGLRPTWKGDPSESILKRQYGGEPIEPKPPEPPIGKYGIIHWQDGTFSDVMPRAEVPA